jgi:hydroxyacylglutathione hydrolase
VLDPLRTLTVLAATEDEARRAAQGLNAVGFLDLAGFVLGQGDLRTDPVSVEELEALLAEGATLIDVREKEERDDGYIAGSRNIPYRLLGMCTDLPTDRPVVTICESGARAAVAASVLAARGVDARPVLDGGIGSWRSSGRPVVEFRRCGSA